ncbi:MAG: protein kinase, partial [Thermoguttaceae bacterium]
MGRITSGLRIDNPDIVFIEKVGQGGFAEVWKIQETTFLQRTLAAKVIEIVFKDRSDRINVEKIRQFREQEAKAWAKFDQKSRNVIPLLQAIEKIINIDGTECLIFGFLMPFCELGDLSSYISSNQLQLESRKELRRFLRDIAEGLKAGHDLDIVHCDIKATNILLFEENGRLNPKLMDFGTSFGTNLGPFTGAGTPEYMAPERFDNLTITPDKSSDVYSLGVLF